MEPLDQSVVLEGWLFQDDDFELLGHLDLLLCNSEGEVARLLVVFVNEVEVVDILEVRVNVRGDYNQDARLLHEVTRVHHHLFQLVLIATCAE